MIVRIMISVILLQTECTETNYMVPMEKKKKI